jgi:DNA-directed RNA polymerase alpha subunit
MSNDLSEWDISYRTWHALHEAGVYTADDVRQLGQQGLMRLVNIGKVAVAEIVQAAKKREIDIPLERGRETLSERVAELELRLGYLDLRVIKLENS